MSNFPAPPTASHELTREALQEAWQWIADNETRVFAFVGAEQHGQLAEIAKKLRAALAAPVVAPAEPIGWIPVRALKQLRDPGTVLVKTALLAYSEDGYEPLFASPVSQGEQPALAQLAPISDDRIRQVWNQTQDPIATVRALLSEAVHPSPAPQEQPEPAGVEASDEPGAAGKALAIKEHREKQARAAGVSGDVK